MKRTREQFEHALVEFFHRHDETKVDLAHTLSHRYVNHQAEVFEHLTELYHEKEGLHISEAQIFSYNVGGGSP